MVGEKSIAPTAPLQVLVPHSPSRHDASERIVKLLDVFAVPQVAHLVGDDIFDQARRCGGHVPVK